MDLKIFYPGTLQKCKNACLDTSACVAIVWDKAGQKKGKCVLKNNQHSAPKTSNVCVAAYKSCFKKGNIISFKFNNINFVV